MDKTTEELKRKKKTKLFNKVYTDMQTAINASLKKKSEVYTVSNHVLLVQFEKDIDSHYKMYEECDEKLFDNCNILQRIFKNKPQLSSKNKEVVWKYIQTLYSLAKEENKQVTRIPQKEGLESLVEGLMSNGDSGFKSIIEDISAQLQQASIGKDINQQTIVRDLMSGNLESSGIDFKKIIESTSKNLEMKINSGEIDRDLLTQTADKIKNTLNMK
jgi:hypothetical protein